MKRPVPAGPKSTSARDLAIQMLMGGFSGIPITDRDGTVVGLVSELDIIRALRAGKSLDEVTAAEIMTAKVITVNVDATVEEIMEIMDTKQIGRGPGRGGGELGGAAAPIVVPLLAAGDGDLQLRASVLQVEPQRDYRHALGLNGAPEIRDLAPVQQQPPPARGGVVRRGRRCILRTV